MMTFYLDPNGPLITDIVSRHHKKLVMIAARIIGDIYAEEVVQDTWLTLLYGTSMTREIKSIEAWLYRVVVNKSINRKKREQRTGSFHHNNSYSHRVQNSHPEIADYETMPDYILSLLQIIKNIEQVWLSLPETQMKAAEMRFSRNLSTEQIASNLGISKSNSKVSVHRAKSKLLNALAN